MFKHIPNMIKMWIPNFIEYAIMRNEYSTQTSFPVFPCIIHQIKDFFEILEI